MTMEDIEKVKRAVLRKYDIAAGVALEGLEIELSKSVPTAAVVGEPDEKGVLKVKKMVINPDFFSRLTFSQRVFVLAHEVFHIVLRHFSRAADKPEKDAQKEYEEYCLTESDPNKRELMKRKLQSKYHRIWNIATDACINAFLKRDGLSFPDNVLDEHGRKMQFIDMDEGLSKSAEKIYDYLVQKEKEKKENESDKQSQSSGSTAGGGSSSSDGSTTSIDDVDIDNYSGIDSHDSWESSQNTNDNQRDNSSEQSNPSEEEIFDEIMKQREQQSKSPGLKDSLSKLRAGAGLDQIVPVKPVVSWKRFLVGTLEKTEEVWGTRRASRFNPNARIEERTYESMPNIEVVLDTSGSISPALLKGFLMQLVTLFDSVYGEEITIKVGCFGDDFSGFTQIKTYEDIKNYKVSPGGGTNFEIAATAFSPDKGRNTTKIVFTDGVLGIPQRTQDDSIIWIVFGDNMNFKPVGGRIIKVSSKEFDSMVNVGQNFVVDNIVEKGRYI